MKEKYSKLPHFTKTPNGESSKVKTIDIEIPFNFKTRGYQKDFFRAMQYAHLPQSSHPDAIRRAILVWHRRAGKEKVCWNFTIKQALLKVGVYFYFFPSFAQGRKVLWDFIDKEGFKVLDHIPEQIIRSKNQQEMKIVLRNSSIIQIIGTDNIDSIVGTNPMGCVYSEFSLQEPAAWTLMRPILVENGGWAVFNFTPRGANHAKELYDMAKGNDSWFTQLLTVKDTKREDGSPVISEADVQSEREQGMSEDYIQQEFYCSFTMGIEGSYYAKNIQRARDENRIGNVIWQETSRVYTAWDIGFGDSTSIIFFQIIGQEIHIIDYYENHGEGFPHYAQVISKKKYLYADHYGPQDIENHHISWGNSVKEVALEFGIKFITLPTLKLSVESGIESLRGIFPRIWIDEKNCKRLILCLENYRKEFDEIHNVYKTRPVHDWASHGADAARYMALGIKRYAESSKGPTDFEVERMRDKYQPIFEK